MQNMILLIKLMYAGISASYEIRMIRESRCVCVCVCMCVRVWYYRKKFSCYGKFFSFMSLFQFTRLNVLCE